MYRTRTNEELIAALEMLNRAIAALPTTFPSQYEYEWTAYHRQGMALDRTTIREELARRGVETTLVQGLDKSLV